ncbi:efflux RND transporter periplasmic adaptor subunit [Verrucomicrobiaceae bacterium N1E253]|uniref:Efflux RND transporter periplasmic adaptor subunit n=1 Tax=Oceaniferula marina TaxID=2748318 RepID=A0A851GGS2_9BACT|nr:efflux RND transporter periplasmic adaptor subunit [Oceaniferula marina]NWK54337.1 efflux RND transporter periplasmic adaptor subunit [Oceaniferula marina]
MHALKKILSLGLIPLVILALGGSVVIYLIKTKPEPKRAIPPQIIAHVEVINSQTDTHTPWIDTYGTVRSYYETEISSLVAGEIVSISPRFQTGESVRKGDVLVEINTADYLAAIALQKANIAKAKETLLTEQARGRIARSDWQSSGRKLEDASPYTLRVPQQEAAQAAVDSAEAALAKAELDLKRTKVTAPYDAIVQERLASPGSIVGIATPLGRLIAREKAEVRLPLTPDEVVQLKLPLAFRLPEDETVDRERLIDVTLSSPAYPGITWPGVITRTEASVDAKNQVIYVVAEIKAPFDPPGSPLPIGTFVKARMQGKDLPNTIRVPEASIINDHFVWVVDGDSKLRRQTVNRLYSSNGMVIASLPENAPPTPYHISVRPLPSFRNGQEVKAETKTRASESSTANNDDVTP